MPKQIIYYYPALTTFIKKDIEILNNQGIISKGFNPKKKSLLPLKFLEQLWHILTHIKKGKIIICRFAGYHSFLPLLLAKLFNKPSLLIIGGTESHYFPRINYGNFVNSLYGWFTKKSFQFAKHVAPVDESLILSEYTYDASFPSPQGYLAFVENVSAKNTVVHNGYDPEKFYIKSLERIPNSFLTIAYTIDGAEFYRKGIDLILDLAKKFPASTFTIIANNKADKFDLPPNVTLKSAVPQQELLDICNKHEFYLQLSLAEGFPNALCEAMLCGCIPIGSKVFGIPKIISDTGFILPEKDKQLLFSIIEKAMKADKKLLSQKAHDHIAKNFPLKRREKELIELINSITE